MSQSEEHPAREKYRHQKERFDASNPVAFDVNLSSIAIGG
jgi:hypothetical protein